MIKLYYTNLTGRKLKADQSLSLLALAEKTGVFHLKKLGFSANADRLIIAKKPIFFVVNLMSASTECALPSTQAK